MSNKAYIHPSATVADDAQIGEDTSIWVNSQIRENVRIGKGCNICKDTFFDVNVIVGDYVKVKNGVAVFQGVTIEDYAFIGPNAVFTNDMFPRSFSTDWEIVPTLVKEGASIGANATILCGVTLGEYCLVGAGSVVLKDVPPYTLVVGNPAREIGKVCRCGRRLQENLCPACETKEEKR